MRQLSSRGKARTGRIRQGGHGICRRLFGTGSERTPDFDGESLEGITGLHMHNLCEKNSDAFARTLAVFEEKFADIIPQMQWINLGGGHHITRQDYDIELLAVF